MRELREGRVDHRLGSQLSDGKPSDGGRALTVAVEDSVKGHGVESEERSVLHVARSTGRHAAVRFYRYDGVAAERLTREYEKVCRGRKERGEGKERERGVVGEARGGGGVRWESTGTCFKFRIAATLLIVDSENGRCRGSRSKKFACKRVIFSTNPRFSSATTEPRNNTTTVACRTR